ncbi:Com family DNA-binding transcriptional regulator [Clostridium gasigenes]|nr:Com family DNA-binding transcriptional regulator [Clostridium gasigenes]
MIKIKDVRCPKCNQLLLKADYIKGEIKCPRCKEIIKVEKPKTEFSATR